MVCTLVTTLGIWALGILTDILIVAVGGFLLGAYGALCSALAFLIKVVGIELLVAAIKRCTKNSKG